MKIWWIMTLVSVIEACIASAAPPVEDRGIYALWYQDDLEMLNQPYITGGQIVCQWRELEPSQGKYDFSAVEERMRALSETGRKATIQINGNQKPEWLFSKVPYTTKKLSVQVRDKKGTLMYWHPVHLNAYTNLLKSFARFLAESEDRDALIGIRLNFNPIGTEHLNLPNEYKQSDKWTVPADVQPGTDLTEEVLTQYQDEIVNTYVEHLAPFVKVFVRNNISTEVEDRYRELFDTGKIGWFHTSTEAEPRSTGTERKYVRFYNDCRGGKTVGYAEPWASAWGDHGGQVDHRPFSPPQWNYWRLLLDLNCGISYIGIYKNDLNVAINGQYHLGDHHYDESKDRLGYNKEFEKAFIFTAKYAGYHNSPDSAPGAWVAFRDGPEILARNAKSPNQLKLNHFTGDYDFLMKRLPDNTIGVHNVGPDNQRYGAWARVIPSGQSMILRPDPKFLNSMTSANLSVTYLDESDKKGSDFIIRFNDQEQRVRLKGTGRWVQATMKLSPVANSDVEIITGKKGICLHMVEMTRP